MGKGGKAKSVRPVESDVDNNKPDGEAEAKEIKRDLNFDDVTVCCALCCVNCGLYTNWDCIGFSGKIGLLCLHCKICCKCNSYCKTCGCCGPSCQNSGCALCNIQLHGFCLVVAGAFPCNKEVPLAVNVLGWNIYPKCGFCMTIREIKAQRMDRGEAVPQVDPEAS